MLNPRWRKVVRDLWSNKTRTILVVLAIAVGVFAFGSVFITQEVLITDMNAQYRDTNPSNIIMNIKSFDDGLVRWARRQKEVTDAQGRTLYLVKLVGDEKTFLKRAALLAVFPCPAALCLSISRIDFLGYFCLR